MRFDELLYFYAVMYKPAGDSKTKLLRHKMQDFFTRLLETDYFFGASFLETDEQIQTFLGFSDKEAIAMVKRVIQEITRNPASVKNAIQKEADIEKDYLESYSGYIHKKFKSQYNSQLQHSSKIDYTTYLNLELKKVRRSIIEIIKMALQEKHKLNESPMKNHHDLSFDFETKEYRLELNYSWLEVFNEKFQDVIVSDHDRDRYLALLKRESELSPPPATISNTTSLNTETFSSSSSSTLTDTIYNNPLLSLMYPPEKPKTTSDSDKSNSSKPTQENEKEEKGCILC